MKAFIDDNFLLQTDAAKRLFFDYAKSMPIFDYHNHLSAKEIFEHQRYENITQVWLAADHYKWRVMRAIGIEEKYITGNASDYDKFMKWAETLEKIPGNPLYHWAHLELQRYFRIYEPLCKKSADDIWQRCKTLLADPEFDAPGLLKRVNVKVLCTTDEPFDTLEWHIKIKTDPSIDFKVLPTFRPDRIVHIEDTGFREAVGLLEKRFERKISSFAILKEALGKALQHFQSVGCVSADHGFIKFLYSQKEGAEAVFQKALSGASLTIEEVAIYKGELLRFLAGEYARRGMAMQLHMGAMRNNNTPMFKKLGPNCGFDSVGETTDPFMLSAFLDDLEITQSLPKTILYCLNATDNTVLSTMAVNHACSEVPGKVQFGSAWWFEDHARGISRQIDELLETGLISASVGMLTDSRSFTSFARHEYYRRILCNKLGLIMERGEYPDDFEAMGILVKDVCYRNAVRFFGMDKGNEKL